MSSAAVISRQIEGGGWAGGAITYAPNADACAEIGGIAGVVYRYVTPLRDFVDDLMGDSAQVAGFAAQWEDASAALRDLPADLIRARELIIDGDGRSVRALRARFEDLAEVSGDAGTYTAATASALRLASKIVEATRTFICDFLVDLGRLSDEMFSFTLNPIEAFDRVADFADAAFDLVQSAGRLVGDVLSALQELGALIARLVPIAIQGLEQLKEIVAQMLPAVGALLGLPFGLGGSAVGLLLGGTLENFLQGTPDVEEIDPADLSPEQLIAWNKAHGVTEFASLADLVSANGTTDSMGGADQTAIDIKRIVAADGTEHYVISLPSTQDWQFGADAGALNDRDSNVALMMDNPLLRGVYERMVLEAMRKAGVPEGAEVVLTGFSQGGIMAANLASDPSFPYETIGVVTNGSPIDSFSIPPNIPVYAFQHANDPVPALDGKPPINPGSVAGPGLVPTPSLPTVQQSTSPNVNIVTLAPPGGALDIPAAHNNQNYANSVAEWEAAHGTPQEVLELFAGEVVDHTVYGAREPG